MTAPDRETPFARPSTQYDINLDELSPEARKIVEEMRAKVKIGVELGHRRLMSGPIWPGRETL